jgi:nucleoside-diphosphate-sugar epimerase
VTNTALVIGGTGPTGHFVVGGLRARGFRVTILHRGNHEVPEIPDDVEHIHVDPHFRETLAAGLLGRTFDLTIAAYGRTRLTAEVLAGRTGQFISASGVTYRSIVRPDLETPAGGPAPCFEDDAQPSAEENSFVFKIAETERAVLRLHPTATVFRYPYVYGPYQLVPREWSILRRFLDGRDALILPEGGMTLVTHGYAANVAAALLAAVDRPEAAAGQVFNCGDERQYTLRQVAEIVAEEVGWQGEILSAPAAANVMRGLLPKGRIGHRLFDLTKLRVELGYRDAVHPKAAIAHTARWLLAHRPEPGGQVEQALADPFDYALEDRLADILRKACAGLASIAGAAVERRHPYAHPKRAGEADPHGR